MHVRGVRGIVATRDLARGAGAREQLEMPVGLLQEQGGLVVWNDAGRDVAELAKDLADIQPAGQGGQQVVECVELAELVTSAL
jgi:hypothetical protein